MEALGLLFCPKRKRTIIKTLERSLVLSNLICLLVRTSYIRKYVPCSLLPAFSWGWILPGLESWLSFVLRRIAYHIPGISCIQVQYMIQQYLVEQWVCTDMREESISVRVSLYFLPLSYDSILLYEYSRGYILYRMTDRWEISLINSISAEIACVQVCDCCIVEMFVVGSFWPLAAIQDVQIQHVWHLFFVVLRSASVITLFHRLCCRVDPTAASVKQ